MMINKFFKKEAPFLGFLGMGGGIARGGGGAFEATGGSVSTISDGGQTYTLHTFNAAPNAPQPFLMTGPGATVEFFLVGGGGAGSGGGGGGGGILTGNFESFAGDVAVKVGNGRFHPGGTCNNVGGDPLSAEDSYIQHPQFTSHPQYVSNAPNCLAAAGGGGGGGWSSPGAPGGSGGGGGQRGTNALGGLRNTFGATSTFSGATHPTQRGGAGGRCSGPNVTDRAGGGGGAAPDAGGDGPPGGNRNGGNGYTSSFSGSSVTYGGGGGGGGRAPGGAGGSGGPGGGGNSDGDDGNPANPGFAGTDGLGGGGGGGGYGPGYGYGIGGRGGNGIVMIRYLAT